MTQSLHTNDPFGRLCGQSVQPYTHKGFDITQFDSPYVFAGESSHLKRIFHGNGFLQQPDNNWIKLTKRLAKGGSASVVVLGGSETAGIGCTEPAGTLRRHGLACAWSARVVDWLQRVFPSSLIDLENE